MNPNTWRRTALAAALACAIAPASAQTAKERELEARIAELERMVRALVDERAASAAATTARPAPAPAAAPLAGAAPPIQGTTILPGTNPGTQFTLGGFIRTEALATDTDGGEIADSSAGRDLYVPGGIPVGAADEGTDLDLHAKFSRLWFGVDHLTEAGDKASARIEVDLFGGSLGTEVATNTYGVTVRHAYVAYNKWLTGQTWSNFMDVAALPDSVDLVGPTDGTVFVRQPQVRYTSGPWSFSAENPETTINAFGGGARIQTDDNAMPDLTGRYLHKTGWGHLTGAVMARELAYETVGANAIDDSVWAIAGSFSGKWQIDPANDLRFALYGGQGIGRYIGLGIAADASIEADGELEEVEGLAGFVAYRHVFNPKWRGNLYYARSEYDNDVAQTGAGVTKNVSSLSANLFYTPAPKLDIGAELRLAERELESGAEGELNRLHVLVRYSF